MRHCLCKCLQAYVAMSSGISCCYLPATTLIGANMVHGGSTPAPAQDEAIGSLPVSTPIAFAGNTIRPTIHNRSNLVLLRRGGDGSSGRIAQHCPASESPECHLLHY